MESMMSFINFKQKQTYESKTRAKNEYFKLGLKQLVVVAAAVAAKYANNSLSESHLIPLPTPDRTF